MTTIGLGAQWGGPAEDKGITIAPGRGWVGDPGIVLGGNPSPAAAAAGRLGFSPQPGIEQQIAAILGELEVAVAMAAADPSPENQAAVADLAQAYSNATSLALDISPDPGASDDQGVTVGPLGGMSLSDIAQAIEGGIQAADPEGLGRMIGGADFYSGGDEGFGGRQNLGGPTAEEGTSPVEGNAFAATGDDVTSGWGGAGSAFDGANASMSASDFSNAVLDGIMAGGMGFGDIIGGGREMGIGSGFANMGSSNAFGATPGGPAFGGFGDTAENEAGNVAGFSRGVDQASSIGRSLGEISADQAARAGNIADIMSGSISSSPSSSENAFDAATPSGPSFGGFGDTAENEGFGGQVAGSFGADGISDGPGLAGSFGGGDVGVDIASGGFDSGRTGDFAQPGLGQSFGNGDAVAAAVGSENSIGPSFGGAEHGAAAASAISGSDIEGGAAGGLDGGTGMGGITGGSDITGGFGGDGFAGLGDGSGREAGIGGFGEAGTGSGFAGMSSGNAFDGGQSNNEPDSSMGSSSEVSSGGSFGGGSSRGGRGSGGDDGDMSGGWGGGGWGGESDGVSGGFDNGGRGGEHGGLDGGGFGGGVGWG